MNKYIITDTTITIMSDSKVYTIDNSNINFRAAKAALKDSDFDKAIELIDIKQVIKDYTDGELEITDSTVYFDGKPLDGYVVDKLLKFVREGLPSKPLMAFISRLLNNPSKNSVDQLYRFLEICGCPIDDEGYFYAYKAIRSDWLDIYTGQIDNSVGKEITMPRYKVADQPSQACAQGLHIGSLSYATQYGGRQSRMIIVKVDPSDVVSVPDDHGYQKCRVSKYIVDRVMSEPLTDAIDQYVHKYYEEDFEDEKEEDEFIFNDPFFQVGL